MLTNLLKNSNSIINGFMKKTNNNSFLQIASQKFFGNNVWINSIKILIKKSFIDIFFTFYIY